MRVLLPKWHTLPLVAHPLLQHLHSTRTRCNDDVRLVATKEIRCKANACARLALPFGFVYDQVFPACIFNVTSLLYSASRADKDNPGSEIHGRPARGRTRFVKYTCSSFSGSVALVKISCMFMRILPKSHAFQGSYVQKNRSLTANDSSSCAIKKSIDEFFRI